MKVSRCATDVTVDSALSPTTKRVAVQGNPAQALTAGYAVAATSGVDNGSGVYSAVFVQNPATTPGALQDVQIDPATGQYYVSVISESANTDNNRIYVGSLSAPGVQPALIDKRRNGFDPT